MATRFHGSQKPLASATAPYNHAFQLIESHHSNVLKEACVLPISDARGNSQRRNNNNSNPWVAAPTRAGKDSKVLKARSKQGLPHRGQEGIQHSEVCELLKALVNYFPTLRPSRYLEVNSLNAPKPHTTILRSTGKNSDAVSFSVPV